MAKYIIIDNADGTTNLLELLNVQTHRYNRYGHRQFLVYYKSYHFLVELNKTLGNQDVDSRKLKKLIKTEIMKNPDLNEDEFLSLMDTLCYKDFKKYSILKTKKLMK